MLSIHFDERAIEEQFLNELRKKLEHIERRHTFWDMKELMRQTNMGENSIKEKFFYDERFPKHKVGGKWYFPAAECETFLLQWIKEQPTN
ncbi:hypothetical protein AABM38_20640 [Heyndrickxia sp. MSNUG]|uniref:hypothetical protein n=1 Tax=Heyndrickxia sp. MSNUG TaxID=3136677 RepID=UPI003C2FA53F